MTKQKKDQGPWPLFLLVFLEFALSLTLAAYWQPGGLELVISPAENGDPLMVLPVKAGERFTLYYIHSVEGTPVWEEHSIDNRGDIYIEEERFVTLGAGMGHWEGHGTYTENGQHQIIENIHKRIGGFVVRVGNEGTNHTIIWRGQYINLTGPAAGRALLVSAKPVSWLEYLWRRLFPYPITAHPEAMNVQEEQQAGQS
jgi:hypothetical protein